MGAPALSPSWLPLTISALIGGIALLAFSILLVARTVRCREFARWPLSASQEFDLREPGPLSFLVDKPRFRNLQARALSPFVLSVVIEDTAGRIQEASRPRVPLSTKSVGRVRTDFAILAGVEPGHYRVRVAGLPADVGKSEAFLIVARPVSKVAFAAGIVAIIASSALAVGGLIATIATFVPFHRG